MFGFRNRRRTRLRATPLPDAWWQIIDRNVPLIRKMDPADRNELGGIVQVLLDEKHFEGCAGLRITDGIRVTIAAQAALLLLHRQTDYYPTLHTILVYPTAYVSNVQKRLPDGSIMDGPQARLGESWKSGSIVLSWNDVLRSAADDSDGHNVTLHEFAHQLDSESGEMDGAPALPDRSRYGAWAKVLGQEYQHLIDDIHRGHHALLDAYGSTNPAEFFAVATELFFERPNAMKQQYPDLYAQLADFYCQKPAGE